PMIAALWQDLDTRNGTHNVYVDTTVSGQVTVRWDAVVFGTSNQVNVSVTLFPSGRIQLNYGPNNTGISPTVGISAGDNVHYQVVTGYDGQTALTNANSVRLDPNPPVGYTETVGGSNQFYTSGGGTAQNWRSYNTYWTLNLPFNFPYFGTSYTSV